MIWDLGRRNLENNVEKDTHRVRKRGGRVCVCVREREREREEEEEIRS